MKITASICAAVMAFSTVQAAAVPDANAQYCDQDWSPCLKDRAPDPIAVAEALAEAQYCDQDWMPCLKRFALPEAKFCAQDGSPCLKRDAFAAAAPDPHAEPNPAAVAEAVANFCARDGAPCGKRDAHAEAVTQYCNQDWSPCLKNREADAHPFADAQYCNQDWSPCLKRDAAAMADAAADAQYCNQDWSPCLKAMRSVGIEEREVDMLVARCNHFDAPCGKQRRAADALAAALAEPEASPVDPIVAQRCEMGACYEARKKIRALAWNVARARDQPAAFMRSLNLPDEEAMKRGAVEAMTREAAPQFCKYDGSPCLRDTLSEAEYCHQDGSCAKLKRAAEAVAAAIADPEAQYCDQDWSPCLKRDAEAEAQFCGSPATPCGIAKRNLHILRNEARALLL